MAKNCHSVTLLYVNVSVKFGVYVPSRLYYGRMTNYSGHSAISYLGALKV